MRKLISVLLLCLAASLSAWAQSETKNEVGLLLGAGLVPQRTTSTGQPINFGPSLAYSAAYARQIKGGNTALFVEFPFVAEPSNHVQSANLQSIVSLATIFVVPSVRVKFASGAAISPWLSGGFGWGIWEGSEFFGDSSRNTSRYKNTGAAQFGGGVDFRTPIRVVVPIGMRVEARDYYSVSNPGFGVAVQGGGQHNVVVSGGMVLYF